MTGVVASAGPYRAAIAELPLSTRVVDGAMGAIVVVSGSTRWVHAALVAAAAGAVAVVVSDPAFVPTEELRRLDATIRVPVIVARPLLRPDVVRAALEAREGAVPRVLAVDGGAAPGTTATLMRDAIGWLRLFAPGGLTVIRGDGALALLGAGDDIAATLSIASTARAGEGWIHLQVLGETVTDIDVEGRSARVVTSTRAGTMLAPALFESSERLALRRALGALHSPAESADIRDLIADTEVAERLLSASPRSRATSEMTPVAS